MSKMTEADLHMQYYFDYAGNGSRAWFTRIPMSKYDEFKALFGNNFRLRYRGPRGRSTCLKRDATHFSAYMNL